MEPAKKTMGLLDEFKSFALKGNVVDLAVGVIIGAAFGKIVDALVKSVVMPFIGVLMPSDQGYLGWKWVINGKEIPYGIFLGEVVNFVVVAAAVFFIIVKFLGFILKTKKEAAPPPPTKQEELLMEIRDLLKARG